ncbi:translocation/assembly module TamB domain-containing protein [Glaciecola sp. 2405UD65-10]|uniref:translocation/assembly module TamB domain-containing protein n=1 Tax=Glaciecola sp. 2405UD65-10 TaxID=3397244 RepID=UPI003B58CEF3
MSEQTTDTNIPSAPRKHTNWTRRLAYAFLGLILFVVLLVMLALSPLGISIIAGQANKLEGLVIEGESGSFYSSLQFEKIQFNSEQIDLEVNQALLDLSLSCLFLGEVCVPEISVESVSTVLKAQETVPEPETETSKQYVSLPLPVLLEKIKLNSLVIEQQDNAGNVLPIFSLQGLQTSLFAHESFVIDALDIKQINVYQQADVKDASSADDNKNDNKSDTAKTSESSNAPQKSEAFDLNMLANWQYTPIQLPEVFVPVNAQLKAGLIKLICLQGEKPLCINNTRIKAKLTEQKLDAALSLQTNDLKVQSLDSTFKIDLASNFEHELSLALEPNIALTSEQAKPLHLSLVGNAFDTSLVLENNNKTIVELKLAANIASSQLPLELSANASSINASFSQWFKSISLPLSSFTAVVNGNTNLYQLDIHANTIEEKASRIVAQGEASLTDKFLKLSKISTNGALGVFDASSVHQLENKAGKLALVNKLDLAFQAFKPMLLVPSTIDSANNAEATSSDISALINGKLALNARYSADTLSGSLLCQNIQGNITRTNTESSSKNFDVNLLCDIELAKSGLLSVKNLSFKQGKNSINGKGKITLPSALSASELGQELAKLEQSNSDFSLQIDMPELSSLYAPIKGQLKGNIKLAGEIAKPTLQATIAADSIAYEAFTLKRLDMSLSSDIANDFASELRMSISELYQNELLANSITVEAQGDAGEHQLSLALEHPEYGLAHSFNGSFKQASANKQSQWKGKWEKGEWRLPFDQISLQSPAPISLSASNSYLGAHCWVSLNSTSATSENEICVNNATYENEEAQLSANIQYDLAAALIHYLPDMIQVGSKVPLRSNINLSSNTKNGVSADMFNVITAANLQTTRHNIELSAIVANLQLSDDVVTSNVFAGTTESGAFGLRSVLNLAPVERSHKGEVRIEAFDVSPLLRFLPGAEKLAGTIDGSLRFEGALDQPLVNGKLDVSEGELIIDNYPYPFSNFNQTIEVVNSEATIEGEFELGSGDANYNAKASFADGLSISGEVQGSGMQLAYQNSELLASPNFTFDVTPDNVKLSGSITIPNADIQIKNLPKSAKSPSSDTIVIGKPVEPPAIPIGLDVDLHILLDVPKLSRVNIEALDLKASLAGDLQLRVIQKVNKTSEQFSPMQTYLNGSINILSGKYEAYGQMLQIRSGDIYFNGPPSLPQFDITAIRNPLNTQDQVIAGVQITGNPMVPKVELFSEPDMIQARQLSYLLQGTDLNGGTSTSNDVQLVNALVNFGISSGGNQVNKLGKNLGFDSLNIQTAGGGDSTQVQVTGRISDRIQVTYGVGLFDSVTEVILKYQLMPKLYIEAKSGTNSAVDLFYEMTRGEND